MFWEKRKYIRTNPLTVTKCKKLVGLGKVASREWTWRTVSQVHLLGSTKMFRKWSKWNVWMPWRIQHKEWLRLQFSFCYLDFTSTSDHAILFNRLVKSQVGHSIEWTFRWWFERITCLVRTIQRLPNRLFMHCNNRNWTCNSNTLSIWPLSSVKVELWRLPIFTLTCLSELQWYKQMWKLRQNCSNQ